MDGFTGALVVGVDWMVAHGLLPLTSILIEPAKILFLNNAINHGILSPIGAEQIRTNGQSILLLLETNPGPGLGILLAYCFFEKEQQNSQHRERPSFILLAEFTKFTSLTF